MLRTGEVVERYKVDTLVGEGGMAKVYLVRHRQLNSLHVLKVLNISGQTIQQRLVQEGRIQASLHHPNIVAVTDVLMVGGAPALLMPFVDGPPLENWIREINPVPIPAAEKVFQGILAGLREAHSYGLVHRDLKPSNVLLSKTVDGWIPMISDFGIAKAMSRSGGESSYTHSGLPMGTPSYMAPEQINDAKDVDQRADIFAMGCILYELLTGTLTFGQQGQGNIFMAILNGHYIPTGDLRDDLPERLLQAIDGCLKVDREDRIQSCESLKEVLGYQDQGSAVTTGDGIQWNRSNEHRREAFSNPSFLDSQPTMGFLPSDSGSTPTYSEDNAFLVNHEAPTVPGPSTGPGKTVVEPEDTPTEVQRSAQITQPTLIPQPGVNPWRIATVVTLAVLVLAGVFALTQLDRLDDLESKGGTTFINLEKGSEAEPDADTKTGSDDETKEEADAEGIPGTEATAEVEVEPDDVAEVVVEVEDNRRRPRETKPVEEPESEEPVVEEVTGTGILKLSADPFAYVYVDGVKVGRTPLDNHPMPAGSYQIRLETMAGASIERLLQVNPDERTFFCWDFNLGAGC
jgi:serine/threonine-protein kinase